MKSVADLFFSLLNFLGLLEEPPQLRKNFKRTRVYDDFSSDDETPVLGYRPVKRICCSNTIDNHDKEGRYNNPVQNVSVQIKGSYTTSTPKKSHKRMVPADLPGLSRNGPSSPPKETNAEQEEAKVAWVESKLENTKKKSSILHMDLDDDDSDNSQHGDDVVFVKELTRPSEHDFATNSHATGLSDQVLSEVLEKIKSEKNVKYQELLRRIANAIKPMSKEKPIGDGKLTEDSPSFRLPKTTQMNILHEIKSDNELNTIYQNAPQEQDPIRLSSTDSSDSDDDVEVVPLESSTTSSMRKDSNRNIAELSRNWLLELDSECNSKLAKNQAKINDARRVSGIISKVNSDQTIAQPHSDDKTDTSEGRQHHLLLQLDSNKQPHNKSVIQKTQEKMNDSRRASVITLNGNGEQNEVLSSSRDTIKDWLAKLDAKYFSTPLKTPEKLNDVQQNEAQSFEPDIAGAGLSRLESKNKTSLLKSHEKHNDAPQESKILSKVNTVQNEDTLDTTRKWLANLETEYFSTPTKAQENRSNAQHESNIEPKVNEQNDIRSYLPAASRGWLLQLDAKYKTTPQKNQENLNNARQELNNVSKVSGKDISLKVDSTDDWLEDLKSSYAVQHKRQEQLNDASRELVMVTKLNSNQNESCSHKPDNARETLSKSDSKPKTEQPKMQKKPNDSHQEANSLAKVNSEQTESRSFKFKSSEDLKLSSLYDKCRQKTQEKRRKSLLNPYEIKQVNSEQNHELSISKTEESDVGMQSNVDLLALTPEQEKLVDGVLEPEPEEELLVERFNLRIHRRDLQTLSDLNWLNDEVINFYMNLIMQRSEERKDLPKVYATNTFFYPKLMQSGQAGLKRWTRKVDIFAYDLFVVPVNVGLHWCLSIVDFRERIIKYLDSRGKPNQECLDALLQYLKDEHQDKKDAPFDVSGWKTECVTDIPQQMNGSDCGMFACTFAEFSSRDAAYSFTQAHMPYLRRKAVLEILMGKLLL